MERGIEEAAPSPLAREREGTLLPLDRRVVTLWRLTGAITAAVVLASLLVPGAAVAFANPGTLVWIGPAWLLFGGLLMFWVLWFPARRYRAWGYRIDQRVLEIHHGVWFQTIQLLPLSRLQHVDLQRGPLERARGLASLLLHTAGTHEASLAIPGLDANQAVRLRDHLVAAGGDDAV